MIFYSHFYIQKWPRFYRFHTNITQIYVWRLLIRQYQMKGRKENPSVQNQTKMTQYLTNRGIINKNTQHISHQMRDNQRLKRQNQKSKSNNSNRSHSNRSHTQSLMSSISASSNIIIGLQKKKEIKVTKQQDHILVNILFYENKIASKPYGQFIDKIHSQWYNNYDRLQRDHSFIQWIFPNSFQSRFNMHASPLSLEEAQQFKKSEAILNRYIKSYNMMLAFYGMKIKNKQTGQLTRSRLPDYKERYYKTLLTSFHNHMRITRILCSLTELGFVKYASQLSKFLKDQIYSPGGQLKNLQKYNVFNDWKIYQHYVQDEKNTNVYMIKLSKGPKHLQTERNKQEKPRGPQKKQQIELFESKKQ